MKHILTITALLFTLAQASAQPLAEIGTYLNNRKIYEGAKQYYRDEIKTEANDTTRRIADSLNTKNNAARPFYILQVSKMLRFSDANLSKMLFPVCYSFLQNKPNELVEFLYCDNNYVLGDYKDYWATAISWQLRKEATDDPKAFLGKMQEKLAKKCKKKNQPNFEAFFQLISARF